MGQAVQEWPDVEVEPAGQLVQLPPLEDWVPAGQLVQCSPQVLPEMDVVLGGH